MTVVCLILEGENTKVGLVSFSFSFRGIISARHDPMAKPLIH